MSISSEEESEPEEKKPSPINPVKPPPKPLKRKSVSEAQPSAKRKKSQSEAKAVGLDNPARKYCRGKLEELFVQIFTKYRSVVSEGDTETHRDLSDQEKEAIVEEANQYADQLEQCIFEHEAELDKQGLLAVGGKYR